MREKYKGNARDAHLHMQYMSVTCPTFHADRSPLNEVAPKTVAGSPLNELALRTVAEVGRA